MSWSDRHYSMIEIIAYAGDKGITLEEIFAMDEKFACSKLRKRFIPAAYINPEIIIQKGDRYYLNPEFRKNNEEFIPDWMYNLKLRMKMYDKWKKTNTR